MKRVFDLLIAGMLAIATAPLQAIIWTTIRVVDGPPCIFSQQRIGRGGALFTIHKFRTMRSSSIDDAISAEHDTRITCLGAFLRKAKLDELPQLWDVIRGDMSLVGPRPELEKYVALWEPSQRQAILQFRPGITDPASIIFRDEGRLLAQHSDPENAYLEHVLPRKVDLYEKYVQEQSLAGDVGILLQTLFALAGRRYDRDKLQR